MKVDLVCPLYKADKVIGELIDNLYKQEKIEFHKIVFAVTKCDNSDITTSIIKEKGLDYFVVDKQEFSHSLTREKAIKEYCESEIVVMMSQDIRFVDNLSIYNLASEINEKVVYAYGRQVAKKNTIEFYIRESNYGQDSVKVTKKDVEKMQIKAFFSSDAFSAYYRPVFMELNGYDGENMMMSEDMYYSKKIIDNGYTKMYVANAVVEHYHKYTLKQLYNRYYETGKWFHDYPRFNEYKTTESGITLALSVFKKAIKDFNIAVLIKFIPNMTARYLGMKKGQKWDIK